MFLVHISTFPIPTTSSLDISEQRLQLAIPPFRLYSLDNTKIITKENPTQERSFWTIDEFIANFQWTLHYYKMPPDKYWKKYLQIAASKGQDEEIINFVSKFTNDKGLEKTDWKTIRTYLVNKYDISHDLQVHRSRFILCQQGIGEPIDKYIARYINFSQRALFMDGSLLVYTFMNSLWEPVRKFVRGALESIRHEEGYFVDGVHFLVNDSLANLQTIFDERKDYFNEEITKIFNQMKKKIEKGDMHNAFNIPNKRLREQELKSHLERDQKSERQQTEIKKQKLDRPKSGCQYCGKEFNDGHLKTCTEFIKIRNSHSHREVGEIHRKAMIRKNETSNSKTSSSKQETDVTCVKKVSQRQEFEAAWSKKQKLDAWPLSSRTKSKIVPTYKSSQTYSIKDAPRDKLPQGDEVKPVLSSIQMFQQETEKSAGLNNLAQASESGQMKSDNTYVSKVKPTVTKKAFDNMEGIEREEFNMKRNIVKKVEVETSSASESVSEGTSAEDAMMFVFRDVLRQVQEKHQTKNENQERK
ncbi:hypothetical protein G6F57_000287 [Rhizopus arrhizus]|uniref:Retrotransposon gag domain-containing protein n=1 Tax=Rhizopus oryzae TaxID=64495 RepID=A0A9P6XAZ1_RHIOR|nr:hypothetical protein G6F23_006121 [Rhizopus arrhizus]KAG1413696.1 hypothetical protein G6F58_007336 [Rhizopus delemar]KAG0765302.1 hypothetical protein G6F24_004527 [Rhizopus arrhizus]KAG0784390.1 hypothetical protein G6F21_009937 [Rhizopus arrhizus]KAG0798376.1 hypothetical protein G6F22_004287 [Rhizopus arrhizus]